MLSNSFLSDGTSLSQDHQVVILKTIPLGRRAVFRSLTQMQPWHLVVHTHAPPSVWPLGFREVFRLLGLPACPSPGQLASTRFIGSHWLCMMMKALLLFYLILDWSSHLWPLHTPLYAQYHACSLFQESLTHRQCSLSITRGHTASSFLCERSSNPGAPSHKYPCGSTLFSTVDRILKGACVPCTALNTRISDGLHEENKIATIFNIDQVLALCQVLCLNALPFTISFSPPMALWDSFY